MDGRRVEYEEKKKSPIVALILLALFGILGAYNFYLGRREEAVAQIALSGAVIATLAWLFLSFSSAAMGALSTGFDGIMLRGFALNAIAVLWALAIYVWLLVNAIRIPQVTARHNLRLHRRMFGE